MTFNDIQTTGKLSPIARDVLDLLWTVQREDGGWKWPHCDYAPMEIDDHYGVTLAALTVGIAPGGYAENSPDGRLIKSPKPDIACGPDQGWLTLAVAAQTIVDGKTLYRLQRTAIANRRSGTTMVCWIGPTSLARNASE